MTIHLRALKPEPLPAGALAPSAPRASTTRRALATAGAAGPVVFLAVSVLAGLLKPGYDVRD